MSRPLLRVLLAVVSVGLALPAAAAAEEYNWMSARDIVVSPDGAHVYATGSTTLSFRVDRATGDLELLGHTEPGAPYHASIAISPDGRFVYVGFGGDSTPAGIHVLSRDAQSGFLAQEETFRGTAASGNMAPVTSLAISVDGRQLYVGQRSPSALIVYDRDLDTGRLTERQALRQADGLPGDVYDIAPSADGRHVYLAAGSIGVLRRDAGTGLLTPAGSASHSGSVWAVALSPDGHRVYGGMTNYATWIRDPETGLLEFSAYDELVDDNCVMCGEGHFISPAPDGGAVFSSSELKATLVQATPTATGVAHARNYVDGQDGYRGLKNPMAVAWSRDGRFAFIASSQFMGCENGYCWRGGFGRDGTVASYRRTADGLVPAEVIGPGLEVPDTCPPGTASLPGITIEDGALYTNDSEVTVTILCPVSSSVRLSNVAGEFSSSPRMRLSGAATDLTWRLDTSPPQRSVKRVYARFTGNWPQDLFDDIILDQGAPRVVSARLRGSRLTVKARDNRSGVKRLQVTTNRRRPGRARRFRRTVVVGGTPRRVYVRVFDGAGNRSRWRVAKRR